MRASEALLLLAAVLGTGDGEVTNGLQWVHKPVGSLGPLEVVGVVDEECDLVCAEVGSVEVVGGVSWVRVSPVLEVISSVGALFSSSPRLHLTPGTPPALRFSPLLYEDEGLYECQLNTEPKRAWRYRLVVLKHGLPGPPPYVEPSMQRDLPAPPAPPAAPPISRAPRPVGPHLVLALLALYYLLSNIGYRKTSLT